MKWLHKPVDLKKELHALYAWTPDFAPFEDAFVFLDLEPVASLYDGRGLYAKLQTHLQTPFEWFEGSSLLSVWSQANGQSHAFENLHIKHLEWLINPFQNLSPEECSLLARMRARLEWLGIQTIEEYRLIPMRERASRFGQIARLTEDRLMYPQALGWPRFQYTEPLFIDQYNDEGIHTVASLFSLIEEMLSQVWKRIGVRAVEEIQISCGWHQTSWHIFSFSFCIPQPSPRSSLAVMRPEIERVWQAHEVYEALTHVRIDIGSVVDNVPMEDQIRLLYATMRTQFGEETCFQATLLDSFVPERSWKRASLETEKSGPPIARERPLTLFKVAKRLRRIRKQLSLLDPPFYTWYVVDWEGPEPVDAEWWVDRVQRYYYKVWTHVGLTLWVYKNADEDLFLHGFFD